MVGPQDGGFGFDQSKKYTSVDNLEKFVFNVRQDNTKTVLQKASNSQVVIVNIVSYMDKWFYVYWANLWKM